jgi:hypothetical protein
VGLLSTVSSFESQFWRLLKLLFYFATSPPRRVFCHIYRTIWPGAESDGVW